MSRISLILSVLALLVSFSGGAVAAKVALAPKNSVGTTAIINGSIQLADLSLAARKGMRGPQGLPGPRGAQGIPGLQGVQGATGAVGGFDQGKLAYVGSPNVALAPFTQGQATASCPPGSKPLGGGGLFNGTRPILSVPSGAGWTVHAFNDLTATMNINAFVVCAAP
jgi:hypothetical protein